MPPVPPPVLPPAGARIVAGPARFTADAASHRGLVKEKTLENSGQRQIAFVAIF
jgi:hypothetical protein